MDPVSFRRDYMGRLAELTVNSRPIIQNLSMVAQEYSRYADVVTECIEQHIRRVSFHFLHSSFPFRVVVCRLSGARRDGQEGLNSSFDLIMYCSLH